MKLSKVYRLSDGLYVQDVSDKYMRGNMIENGEDPDTIYLEKVEFSNLELIEKWNPKTEDHPPRHAWKIQIDYLEDYRRLIDFGYPNDLSIVPYFLASDYS